MAETPDDADAKALGEWTAADTAQLAREGNTEAARDILRTFLEAVQLTSEQDWPAQIPWAFVQYLADAFRKITEESADARLALGLKEHKAGRPAGSKTHDPVRLAAAYWLLRRRGHAPEEANELIRVAVGADRTTVQGAANGCSAFEDHPAFSDHILTAIVAESPALAQLLK